MSKSDEFFFLNHHSQGSLVAESIQGNILFRNGDLTLALARLCWLLWAAVGCRGSGRAPGWCGCDVVSLLRHCCGGAICWRPAICLPSQSVVVGEVG